MPRNVEMRERVGGNFSHADSLLYPKTHVSMVDGLLVSGRIKFDLLPDGVRVGLKHVGVVSTAKTTAELLVLVDAWLAFNLLGETARGGCFFISQYNLNITVSPGHAFEFGDDGDAQVIEGEIVAVEGTDWVMYNGFHSGGHQWIVVNNRHDQVTTTRDGLMLAEDKIKLNGIATSANNYAHPTHIARNIDTDGIVVLDTFTSDTAGHITGIGTRSLPNASTTLPGVMSAADKLKLDGVAAGATANTGTVTSVAGIAGVGINVTGGPITSSGTLTITNTLPNATHTGDVTGSAALTIADNAVTNAKAADMVVNTIKGRLTTGTGNPEDLTPANVRTMLNVADGANNYSHPVLTARSETLNTAESIATFTSDAAGHVTGVTKQAIRTGSTSQTGLIQLATGTELTTALNTGKATSPVSVKAMIDYFAGMVRYASETAANSAVVNDGSIALITIAS